MDIRKSVFDFSATEKNDFLKALLLLKNEVINPTDPEDKQFSRYDQFVALHGAVMQVEKQGWSGAAINYAHNGLGFLPWHREYIRHFELALQEKVPGVTIPYWDWTDIDRTRSELFSVDFLGPLSNNDSLNYITSGYLVPSYNEEKPEWWPDGVNGFKVNPLLDSYASNNPEGFLIRSQGVDDSSWPLSAADVESIVTIDVDTNHDYFSFRSRLEGGGSAHNSGHRWVGGHMGTGFSPNDPVFWMHHAQVDRLWALWQRNIGTGESGYPDMNIDPQGNEIPPGHKLLDRMWPWVAEEAHLYKSVSDEKVHFMLPDLRFDLPKRPIDMLDSESLGPVLGGYFYQEPMNL